MMKCHPSLVWYVTRLDELIEEAEVEESPTGWKNRYFISEEVEAFGINRKAQKAPLT